MRPWDLFPLDFLLNLFSSSLHKPLLTKLPALYNLNNYKNIHALKIVGTSYVVMTTRSTFANYAGKRFFSLTQNLYSDQKVAHKVSHIIALFHKVQ